MCRRGGRAARHPVRYRGLLFVYRLWHCWPLVGWSMSVVTGCRRHAGPDEGDGVREIRNSEDKRQTEESKREHRAPLQSHLLLSQRSKSAPAQSRNGQQTRKPQGNPNPKHPPSSMRVRCGSAGSKWIVQCVRFVCPSSPPADAMIVARLDGERPPLLGNGPRSSHVWIANDPPCWALGVKVCTRV